MAKGNGEFDGPLTSTVPQSFLESPVVADFNGDGKPDLAVASIASRDVYVLLGNGDGSFQAAIACGVANAGGSVAVWDFNGDGKPDLAVPNWANASVSVLLGKGDGSFHVAVNSAAGENPGSAAVADFNGDGKLDLALANYGKAFDDPNPSPGYVSLLLGNGDATFQVAKTYLAGRNPVAVAIGDFNGDGKTYLAVANFWSANVSLLLGNGDGTLQPATNFFVAQPEGFPSSLAVFDLNGDGQPDLLAPHSGSPDSIVTVLLNTCPVARPGLTVARGSSTMTLAWSLPYSQFVLESSTNLRSWGTVVEMPGTNNGHLQFTLALDQAERYFRLRKP